MRGDRARGEDSEDAPLQRVAAAAGGGSGARGGGGVRGRGAVGRRRVAARRPRLRLRHAQVDLRVRPVIACSSSPRCGSIAFDLRSRFTLWCAGAACSDWSHCF